MTVPMGIGLEEFDAAEGVGEDRGEVDSCEAVVTGASCGAVVAAGAEYVDVSKERSALSGATAVCIIAELVTPATVVGLGTPLIWRGTWRCGRGWMTIDPSEKKRPGRKRVQVKGWTTSI
jgi:ABC-type xylose transport system permease subunit